MQSSEVTNEDVDMSSEVKADNSDSNKDKIKKKKKKNKQCSEVINAVVEISTALPPAAHQLWLARLTVKVSPF